MTSPTPWVPRIAKAALAAARLAVRAGMVGHSDTRIGVGYLGWRDADSARQRTMVIMLLSSTAC